MNHNSLYHIRGRMSLMLAFPDDGSPYQTWSWGLPPQDCELRGWFHQLKGRWGHAKPIFTMCQASRKMAKAEIQSNVDDMSWGNPENSRRKKSEGSLWVQPGGCSWGSNVMSAILSNKDNVVALNMSNFSRNLAVTCASTVMERCVLRRNWRGAAKKLKGLVYNALS